MALGMQSLRGEEWEPSIEFAYMLTKITELLNKSADVEDLKDFLKLLCTLEVLCGSGTNLCPFKQTLWLRNAGLDECPMLNCNILASRPSTYKL